MSNEEKGTSSSGGGFLSMLAVLFIGLKLTGYIDWSWWWVTAPLWGGLAAILAFLAVAVGLALAAEVVSDWRSRRAREKLLDKPTPNSDDSPAGPQK